MMHPLLAFLLLAPAADCTEAEPCVLRVTLDGSGVWFDRPGDHEATVQQHRWYTLDVLSQFDEDHTLTLGDHTFRAGGYDTDGPRSRHGPIQFPEAGDLVLRDATAHATATVHVEAAEPPEPPTPPQDPDTDPTPGDGDAQDPPTGSGNEDGPIPERRKDVPGPSPPLVGAATAAAALAALAARDARSRR